MARIISKIYTLAWKILNHFMSFVQVLTFTKWHQLVIFVLGVMETWRMRNRVSSWEFSVHVLVPNIFLWLVADSLRWTLRAKGWKLLSVSYHSCRELDCKTAFASVEMALCLHLEERYCDSFWLMIVCLKCQSAVNISLSHLMWDLLIGEAKESYTLEIDQDAHICDGCYQDRVSYESWIVGILALFIIVKLFHSQLSLPSFLTGRFNLL